MKKWEQINNNNDNKSGKITKHIQQSSSSSAIAMSQLTWPSLTLVCVTQRSFLVSLFITASLPVITVKCNCVQPSFLYLDWNAIFYYFF